MIGLHLIADIVLYFLIKSNWLTLVPYFLWSLNFIYLQLLTITTCRFSFLGKVFSSYVLLFYHVVFLVQFCMETCSKSWHSKCFWNISWFKSLFNFFLKNDQLIFHFGIYISFIISRPKAPKCIANNITMLSLFFISKYIFPQLIEDILSLHQLLFLLLLIPCQLLF